MSTLNNKGLPKFKNRTIMLDKNNNIIDPSCTNGDESQSSERPRSTRSARRLSTNTNSFERVTMKEVQEFQIDLVSLRHPGNLKLRNTIYEWQIDKKPRQQ